VRQVREVSAFAPILTYGLTETVDVAVGPIFAHRRITEDGAVIESAGGLSDTVLELKWRWYEDDGVSFAVKPALTLPTGDESRDLGTGKVSWGINGIFTYRVAQWTWIANLAYAQLRFTREEGTAVNHSDIWRFSGGVTYALRNDWRLAAELGTRTNSSKDDPFLPGRNGDYVMLGTIYSPTDKSDLALGLRRAASSGELDWAVVVGATFRW
jgi:hypothetical protein